MTCGEKIARLRKQNNMTQAELGDSLSVTYQAVSKWERGESLPDFDTISRIAKLFQVPISYFEEGGEDNIDSDNQSATTVVEEPIVSAEIIGMCVSCGKVVREGEEETKHPKLICKACAELARQEVEKRILAEKNAKEAEKQRNIEKDNEAKAHYRKRRNIALIVGAAVAVAVFITFFVLAMLKKSEMSLRLGAGGVLAVFAFTFTTQMIWDGTVREMCTAGGKIISLPGVIFSFSPDGIIFLIIVKIIEAIIVAVVFVASILFCIFLAIVMSPFSFIPSLLWHNREIRKATASTLEIERSFE